MAAAESKKVTETEVISLTVRLRRGSQGLIACQVEDGDEETRVEEVLGTGDEEASSAMVMSRSVMLVSNKREQTRTESSHKLN